MTTNGLKAVQSMLGAKGVGAIGQGLTEKQERPNWKL